jgi:ATP-binding cassette subfamily B protein
MIARFLNHVTVGHPDKLRKPVAFVLLSNLVNLIPFVLVLQAVRTIFSAYASGAPLDTASLWWTCAALVVSLPFIFLAERPAYRACFRKAYSVSAEGRTELAEHLRKLPLGYLTGRDPGDLANMLMGDFALLEHSVSHSVPQLIGALVMPVLALTGLCFLDWRMALAMFAALPVALGVFAGSTKIVRALGSRHMRAKINAGNRLQEYLYGIRVIKAYNLTGTRFERLERSFRELMRQSIRLEGWVGPFVMLAIACMRAGLTIMVLVGVHLLTGGKLDLFVFVAFLIVGSRIFDPLTLALIQFAELRYSEQAGERILNLYREPEMGGTQAPPDSSTIAFDNVSFGYHDEPVLHGVSARMEPGTLTALVGPSGSGKSTMLKLAARFYDPGEGTVRLGGEPMTSMDPERLFRRLSMVFQDVYLFQDTIRNNIRFGREGATDEEVVEAAKAACCHEFIAALPQGYDTPVGEGGCTLSGGEKQRISIARAFLKNAPIVLLDEATASLDPENERDVQKAIDHLIEGRTVIVVAHRLKTICRADRIIVLDKGAIAESGTHEELLAADGLYARMWKLQQESAGWSINESVIGQ